MADIKTLKPVNEATPVIEKEQEKKKTKYDARLQYTVGDTESFRNLRKMFQAS